MDPHAVLRPVGPLPARVYWLRRLAPVVVVLVVVLVIAISCSGGSSRPGASGPAGRHQSPSPSPSPSPSGRPVPCAAADLAVSAVTDATHYAAGTLPHLEVRIRNTGTSACTFLDSPAARTWSIYSGPDLVFTTSGCGTGRSAPRRTLAAGDTARHVLIWNRQRSGPHCTPSTVAAAPGTYRLVVTVAGQLSPAAIFHLTG